MQEEIKIGKNKYPVARCTRIVNDRECNTVMNPARLMCTGCEQMIKDSYQKALEMV